MVSGTGSPPGSGKPLWLQVTCCAYTSRSRPQLPPGAGNRIELCNPVARLIFAPDWPVITWTEAERAKGQAGGLKTIESFHTHGTPPVA